MMKALFSPITFEETKDEIKVIRNSLKRYPTHGRQRAKYFKYKEGMNEMKAKNRTHSSYRCTPNPKDMFFPSSQCNRCVYEEETAQIWKG